MMMFTTQVRCILLPCGVLSGVGVCVFNVALLGLLFCKLLENPSGLGPFVDP